VCVRRWRIVIASVEAGRDGNQRRTGSPSATFPSSSRARIAAAVNCFVTEASL
jgi:hypothetical protein